MDDVVVREVVTDVAEKTPEELSSDEDMLLGKSCSISDDPECDVCQ